MTISEITSVNDSNIDIFTKIPERQLLTINEPAPGIFIAESFKVLERALHAGYEPVSLLVEKSRLPLLQESAIISYLEKDCIPVYTAPEDELDKMTGYHLTGGCLCAMKRRFTGLPKPLLEKSRRVVILENVMNPTNIGAIFRSAAALGMDAVLLTTSCADPLYRRAIRVSMGTVFQIPWTFIDSKELTWPAQGLELLHECGYRLLPWPFATSPWTSLTPSSKAKKSWQLSWALRVKDFLPRP